MSQRLSDPAVERLRSVVSLPEIGAGRYRLIRPLARGGMGTIYLAADELLDREVALKVINTELDDATVTARIEREAKIIARLEHPSIVPVHDLGKLPDGRLYYVMKLVRGRSLDEVLDRHGLSERLRIFLRVCDAISFAHANGVLHRDLKPSNIMVGPFGEVLLMDWGIARLTERTEEAPSAARTRQQKGTMDGVAMGTPGFMAPEQERGHRDSIDERSDIFGLGRILDSMISTPESDTVERGRRFRRPLEAIRDKAAAPERDRRYQTVEALEHDIRCLLDGLPVSAYRAPVLERVAEWSHRNRAAIGVILAYLVMRLTLFAIFRR